jgi:hypothetical protein
MSQPPPDQPQLSEEQLRQIEAEMERITVDDVLLQTLVTLLNLAARKAGLAGTPSPPTQEAPKPDLEQMRQAIDGARAILPLVEQRHADQLGPVRDTLSQLQMAYTQLRGQGGGQPPSGGEEGGGEPPQDPGQPEGPGPAQSSGRLWVPGQ